MSASLRSFSKETKLDVIKRRLKSKTGGLGYLSAVAAAKKIGLVVDEPKK